MDWLSGKGLEARSDDYGYLGIDLSQLGRTMIYARALTGAEPHRHGLRNHYITTLRDSRNSLHGTSFLLQETCHI